MSRHKRMDLYPTCFLQNIPNAGTSVAVDMKGMHVLDATACLRS